VPPWGGSGQEWALPQAAPQPQVATLTDEVPRGEDWFHEIKLDGYRFLAHVDGRQVNLYTRRGLDWSDHFPEVSRALATAELGQCVLDGEMDGLGPPGGASRARKWFTSKGRSPGRSRRAGSCISMTLMR
jgi:bifunctional non-homologous end joining protein LigD